MIVKTITVGKLIQSAKQNEITYSLFIEMFILKSQTT